MLSEFLASGRLGGILAMVLLFSQFDIMSLFDLPFPKPVTMIMSAVFAVVFAEILRLLVKLIFGGGNRSKIYFFITWAIVCLFNFVAVQMHMIFSPLIMSFLLVLAVDVFGRCVMAFLIHRKLI